MRLAGEVTLIVRGQLHRARDVLETLVKRGDAGRATTVAVREGHVPPAGEIRVVRQRVGVEAP